MLQVDWNQPRSWLSKIQKLPVFDLSQAEKLIVTITIVATSSLIALMEYTRFCEKAYDYFYSREHTSETSCTLKSGNTGPNELSVSRPTKRYSYFPLFSSRLDRCDSIDPSDLPPINYEDLPPPSSEIAVSPANLTNNLCWALTAINFVNAMGIDEILFKKASPTSQALIPFDEGSLSSFDQKAIQLSKSRCENRTRYYFPQPWIEHLKQEEKNLPQQKKYFDELVRLKSLSPQEIQKELETLDVIKAGRKNEIYSMERKMTALEEESKQDTDQIKKISESIAKMNLENESLEKLIGVVEEKKWQELSQAIGEYKKKLDKRKVYLTSFIKHEEQAFTKGVHAKYLDKALQCEKKGIEVSKSYITSLLQSRCETNPSGDLLYIEHLRHYLFALFKELRDPSRERLQERQDRVNRYFIGFLKTLKTLIKEFPDKYQTTIKPDQIGNDFQESKELMSFILRCLLPQPTCDTHGKAINSFFPDMLLQCITKIDKPTFDIDPERSYWEYSIECGAHEREEPVDIGNAIMARRKEDGRPISIDFPQLPKKLVVDFDRLTHYEQRHFIPTTIAEEFTLPSNGEQVHYRLIAGDVHLGDHYYFAQKTKEDKWQYVNDGRLHTEDDGSKILKKGSIYLFERVD